MTERESDLFLKEIPKEEADFYLKIEELKGKLESGEIKGEDVGLLYDLAGELSEKLKSDPLLIFNNEFSKGAREVLNLLGQILSGVKGKFNKIEPLFINAEAIETEPSSGISEKIKYIENWAKELKETFKSEQIEEKEYKVKAGAILLYIKAINDSKEKKDEYEGTSINRDQIEFLVNKIQETFQDDLGKKEKMQELDKLFIVEEENK